MLRVESDTFPSLLRCPFPRPHLQEGIQLARSHARPPSPQRIEGNLVMEGFERKRTVVIVGGGIAGAQLAKSIEQIADVILIDPKEYFEIPWANLRSKVEPSFAERSVINHKEYLKNGKVIVSNAVDVTEQGVVTAEGRRVPYDYLVIATGHPYTTIRGRRDRLEKFQEDNQKIICSSSIMIVGGGATGVELAGEIAVDFPDKKLTLVHNGTRLLPFIGHRASAKTLEWLKSKNVKVLLEQSIDVESISESDREFQTSAGEIVRADSYFLCVGKPIGSAWLRDSILKEYLDRNGRLMVDENFKVGGLSNIFAIGDITDIPVLEKKKAIEEIIKAASTVKDHLASFPSFSYYDRNGLSVYFESGFGDQLSSSIKKYIQNLLKVNMEGPYGPDWPIEEKVKRREMVAPEARYIFVRESSNVVHDDNYLKEDGRMNCWTGDGDPLVGFVHYRFIAEEEIPVVYVYELQLETCARGNGLGKFLMQLIELIARKNQMGAAILTVQKANILAMNFYRNRLRYVISAISPSKVDPLIGSEKSYEILCKTFTSEAKVKLEETNSFKDG